MKQKYLYQYFFKSALYSFLFWLFVFVVVVQFIAPFLLNLDQLLDLSQKTDAKMIERQIQENLNLSLYVLGFFLGPTLGILAGRMLIKKESEVMLSLNISRREFFIGSFLFHGCLLASIWFVFVLFYLLVAFIFKQPINAELMLKLVLSIFGILLPFFWIGFFAANTKPIAAILLYLIVFLIVPNLVSVELPSGASSQKAVNIFAKVASIIVPQTQPFQLAASPFSRLGPATMNLTNWKWLAYGILWSTFLLLSGYLIYRRKDLNDPHS